MAGDKQRNSRDCGNAAELRKAVIETQVVIAKCLEILNNIPDSCGYGGLLDDVADELCYLREGPVKAALAAPPRNCDVFESHNEALDAWVLWRGDNLTVHDGVGKAKQTFPRWLFAPAEEKEGETNGSK